MTIEREGHVTHLIAEWVEDISSMFLTLALPVTVDMDDGRAGEMPTLAAEMSATQPAYPKEQAEKLFSNRDLH
ncbi:hypothetical protein [Paracoccus methylarcula]|uniref:Uncharacterized protein n=1 Tax=Paracoccus methylarcula TaxID=72022 RepID=A0A422QVM9_9RHOB|nr:hypothetical protein [Paracoccus methylarcula]RNF34033.1 hypothetical protein A7A09_014150 [Paracoccus methylarcula]